MSRLLRVGGAGLLGVLISTVAGGIWTAILIANLGTTQSVPWSAPAMAIILWLGWRYLAGDGPPRSTSAARRRLLGANPVEPRVLAWAVAAGVCGVIALAGIWIVFVRLVPMPPNALPDYSAYPVLTIALAVAMGSLVSPLSEEAGFRGYCQTILEAELRSPVAAIAVSSLFFTIPHIPVAGLFIPKLFVYFLAGLTFGAVAYFANSILASIPVHIVGDLTFFVFVWPFDGTRSFVTASGTDGSFWLTVAQIAVFGALAIAALSRLRRVSLRPVSAG